MHITLSSGIPDKNPSSARAGSGCSQEVEQPVDTVDQRPAYRAGWAICGSLFGGGVGALPILGLFTTPVGGYKAGQAIQHRFNDDPEAPPVGPWLASAAALAASCYSLYNFVFSNGSVSSLVPGAVAGAIAWATVGALEGKFWNAVPDYDVGPR